MIVRVEADRVRCVTQTDHARLAAAILELWRRSPLPDHPRRSALLTAVREHDNGWQEADAAPRLGPRGDRPLHFLEASPEERREIWGRGVARHRSSAPYVAALIAHHGWFLHRDDEEGLAARAGALLEIRDDALEEIDLPLEELERDYHWLHLADLVSLVATAQWPGVHERGEFRVERAGAEVTIEPFPLAGATTFSFPVRSIPRRTYRDDVDLAVELATARWTEETVRLTPKTPTFP